MNQIKVGFFSRQNYLDKTTFSGTLYYMRAALKARNIQVIDLGDPKNPSRIQRIFNRIIGSQASQKAGTPQYIAEHKKFINLINKQLQKTPCDLIFAPVAKGELTYLETTIPIVSLSDTTFTLLKKAYQLDIDEQQSKIESEQEFIVAVKARKLVYPSEWAAKSAIDDYQAEPEKIAIIPFGANLDAPPSVDQVLLNKQSSLCRLLFVGRDWSRKGGDIAFQTLIALCEKGINTELIVVGGIPPANIQHEKLTIVPFLNKNNLKERKQLDELFLKSNIFIFPTRADCSPMVIGEANAFGLPAFTTDVGGIPTIVRNGKNGYMLPVSATGEDYANLIIENFSNRTIYDNLVRSSRKEYDSRLNWDRWAESMHQLFLSIR